MYRITRSPSFSRSSMAFILVAAILGVFTSISAIAAPPAQASPAISTENPCDGLTVQDLKDPAKRLNSKVMSCRLRCIPIGGQLPPDDKLAACMRGSTAASPSPTPTRSPVAPTPTPVVRSSWKTFDSPEMGFRIRYPANWHLSIDGEAISVSDQPLQPGFVGQLVQVILWDRYGGYSPLALIESMSSEIPGATVRNSDEGELFGYTTGLAVTDFVDAVSGVPVTSWNMAVAAPLGMYLVMSGGPTSLVGNELSATILQILSTLEFYVQ